jgi:hypothetical protein
MIKEFGRVLWLVKSNQIGRNGTYPGAFGLTPIQKIRPFSMRTIKAKICFGSRFHTGERFTERLLTVISTCRIHDANSYDFFSTIVLASFSDKESLPELPHLLQQ